MDDKTANNSITNFEEEYSSDGQLLLWENLVTSPKGEEDVKVILLKKFLL